MAYRSDERIPHALVQSCERHEAHRFAPVGLYRDQYRPALVREEHIDHQGRWRSGQKPARERQLQTGFRT